MSNKTATARKNGVFGYKALVIYANGRTHIPIQRNFRHREDAVAYAQTWINANNRPDDKAILDAARRGA